MTTTKLIIGSVAVIAAIFLVYGYYTNINATDSAALATLDFTNFPLGKYVCSIYRIAFDSVFSGTMFISNRKARVDFPERRFHVVAKDGKAYLWQDDEPWGIRGPAATIFAEPKNSPVVSRSVNCKRLFYVDDKLFELPSSVDFRDVTDKTD